MDPIVSKRSFDTTRFNSYLKTNWIARNFVYLDSVPSTNNWLKENGGNHQTGTVVLAEQQNAGKGQQSKSWVSEPGLNLTFSVLLRPGNPQKMHTLPMTAALNCADVLQHYAPQKICIKWPNDLYCNAMKIGGILVESSFTGSTVEKLILGIGLNINQKNVAETVPGAASLVQFGNNITMLDRENILARILNQLEEVLTIWEMRPDALRREVNRRLIGYGCYGTVIAGNEKIPGTFKFMGTNEDGYPVFLSPEADIITFKSEQVRFEPNVLPCEPD
jgi:BirA family transcriptional regulator, biotin operon repressor / biotin---[acetyl-CoA-carboxylase] ligase